MFQVNDVIIYGAQGVCKITDKEEKTISGVKKTYFVLKPVGDKGSTIFAPTDNEYVLKKMRRLLTKDEIYKLIDSMPDENAVWVVNENERKELYKNILAKGDHLELIKMIKAIYTHKKEREAEGKRLHMSDERFFRDAEQILYNEFQYVLDLKSKNDLMAYIFERIEKNSK
ncbi:MAG: CarD family transcriptional regulator [Oscillospiraceae bacterium]|nr:CarD family transcriptional regulator [Oscillospiraceae bacterium]